MVTDNRKPKSFKEYQSTNGSLGQQIKKGALTTPVETLPVQNEMKSAPKNTSPNNIQSEHKRVKTESDGVAEFSSQFRLNELSFMFSNSRFEVQVVMNRNYYIHPSSTESSAPHKTNKN